ncbi:Serine threonine-protein kinase ppk6 [Coniochaeta hoffmannii]|uniref:Serine threonine-protein kinase ppk6 n=1 Tax=Coniochaeta hoffmannii TaxID=91930 RepID=A0AA38R249_9PEZI|nr:Serine threonine-protein kinase ppk6 [Coniochaeta hoffmannii]
MSADLLGLFDEPSQAPKQPQQNSGSSGPGPKFSSSTTDPFSFLQPSTASAQPQAGGQSTDWPSRPPQQPPAGNIWGDLSGLGPPVAKPQADEEEDGWGDFESAAQNEPPKPARVTLQSQSRPTTRIVRAPTIDLMSNNLLSLHSSPPKPNKLEHLAERASWESSLRQSTDSGPKTTDPNVLFDADDFDEGALPDDDDDDDFGDFEAPAPAPAPPSVQPSIDLLSTQFAPAPVQGRQAPPSQLLSALSLNDGPSVYPQAPKSPSFQERNPFPGLGLKTPVTEEFPKETKSKTPSPITAWPTFENAGNAKGTKEKNSFEAEWGAFDDMPPKTGTKPQAPEPAPAKPSGKTTVANTTVATSDWEWDDWSASKETPPAPKPAETTSPSRPPPTNIPPPSVLLSIFPSLLSTASTSLFKPSAATSSSVRDRVHSSPATIAFLRGYLALATVAARIIAGRRLRWHRDKFLSQSMTISAATGGKGGMKLAGIDRSQSAREDREAADVVAVWRDAVGRLRTAVAAANAAVANGVAASGGRRQMRVPELAEVMRVETVKGAITAPKACVVCGLKRDERVVKVDFEVEDSFGEWWVEFWGHRECRNFWIEHEVALRSR